MNPQKESLSAQTFQPNAFYETLLRRQREDRELYERTFSPALRLSVEFYVTTKRKFEASNKQADENVVKSGIQELIDECAGCAKT